MSRRLVAVFHLRPDALSERAPGAGGCCGLGAGHSPPFMGEGPAGGATAPTPAVLRAAIVGGRRSGADLLPLLPGARHTASSSFEVKFGALNGLDCSCGARGPSAIGKLA